MKNTKNNILKKIKAIGFKTPKNYFDSFEEDVLKKKRSLSSGFKAPMDYFENFEYKFSENKNLEEISTTGFKTPANYFEKLENKIIPKSKKTKIVSLNRTNFIKNTAIAIAASLLLFFSISKFNSSDNTLNSVAADSEIEAWMEAGLISFNTYEIEDVFSDKELNLIAEETDEVTNYLNQTDIDILLYEN